jgi:flagellar hook-length control protein FliK
MNIEGANLAPKALGSKPMGNDALAPQESGQNADSFTNALKGQSKAFERPSDGMGAQAQAQEAPAKPGSAEADQDDGGHQEIADFIGQYFPGLTASANNAAGNETMAPAPDAQPTLAAVPENSALGQGMGNLLASLGLAPAKPAPEADKQNSSPDADAQGIDLKAPVATWQSGLNKPETSVSLSDKPEAFKQSLDALAGAEIQAPETTLPEPNVESTPTPKPAEARMEYASIAKPISHSGWGKDLGEHIIWMTNKAVPAAEIKMNPEHLGPITVRIDVNNDNQTSILFTAQHAEAKEALEASIPKLREMLQGQQLNLVNVNISQNPGSQHGRPAPQAFLNDAEPRLGQQDLEPGDETRHVVSKGLLSLYA